MKRNRETLDTLPEINSIFRGEVASLQPYGIFVKIPNCEKNGLVHISQISNCQVERPEDVVELKEKIYCKVISVEPDGQKISLSMKVVNQTTGADLDPNLLQTSRDEQQRKKTFRKDVPKIELGAVFDTVCKKCGGKGHLAQDCFHVPGGKTYELVEEVFEWEAKKQTEEMTATRKHKKNKKESKERRKHKKRRLSDSGSRTEAKKAKKWKHKESSSDSDTEPEQQKKKRKESSSSDGTDDNSSSTEYEGKRISVNKAAAATKTKRCDADSDLRSESSSKAEGSQIHRRSSGGDSFSGSRCRTNSPHFRSSERSSKGRADSPHFRSSERSRKARADSPHVRASERRSKAKADSPKFRPREARADSTELNISEDFKYQTGKNRPPLYEARSTEQRLGTYSGKKGSRSPDSSPGEHQKYSRQRNQPSSRSHQGSSYPCKKSCRMSDDQ